MMKTKFMYIAFVLGLSLLINGTMVTYGQNQFKTQKEAIQQAQQDFIKILQSEVKIDAGVNAEQLKEANPMEAISYLQLDYDELISTDSAFSFNQLAAEKLYYVVPLSAKSKVVSVIKISKEKDFWKVAGMGDKLLTDNLNDLPDKAFDNAFESVKIYEAPNIQALVYVMNLRAEEVAFTGYGNFDIRKEEKPMMVIETVIRDAKIFQDKWGEQLKKGKLLK